MHSIQFSRIKSGSLFKLTLTFAASVIIPFCIICGIAALFGAPTVTVNQQYATGIKGFIAALVMGPLFSLIFSTFAWTGIYITMRLIGKHKPFTLNYVPSIADHNASAPEIRQDEI